MKRLNDGSRKHDPVLDVMSSGFFSKSLGQAPPTREEMSSVNEQLSQKQLPKNIKYYPIYADQPHSWQGDLMFEPYINSKKEKMLIAILCVININTRYAFAEAVDYYKNQKAIDESEWRSTSTKIPVNNKSAPLVLRSFQRILTNMKHEADVLNEFQEFKGQAQFDVRRLYVDEGSEFKGVFSKFCDENNIRITVFKPSDGSKRRLAIVERFNRTLRRLIEKQIALKGGKEIKYIIPDALDMYNRYLNHRDIEAFFRRDMDRGERWQSSTGDTTRFFPAMMVLPGMEEEYITYMTEKTHEVDRHYSNMIQYLVPGVLVRYFKRIKDPFSKSRGSTMSEPVKIIGRHQHKYASDEGGARQKYSVSYSVEGTTQRFLPYELRLVNPPADLKNKKPGPEYYKEYIV
jgi:hypothetical protein